MNILDEIYKKEPKYSEKYYNFILEYTIQKGGKAGSASEDEKWVQGKFFSSRYEMFMYAAFLGLRCNYKLPIAENAKRVKFEIIENWKPRGIADYLIMAVLGKGDYDLFQIEQSEEEEQKNIVRRIIVDIESYANAGFDIIKSKAEEDERFFLDNDNCFIDLLDMTSVES